MGEITKRFFQTDSKGTARLLFILFLLIGAQVAQCQSIGAFSGMDGGFEGQTATTSITATTTPSATAWTIDNSGSTTIRSIISNASAARSGAMYLSHATTSSKYIQSPYVSASSFTANVKYIVQFYIKSTNSGFPSLTTYITPNGTRLTATSAVSGSYAASTWVKTTAVITMGATIGSTPFAGTRTNNFDALYDDFVVYPADNQATPVADITAPNAPTGLVVSQVNSSPTSGLALNWTAPSGGVDGGGYVVVRYSANPNAANDPLQNSIFAVGNTTNGTTGTNGTVVYIGTATTFTDTSIANNMVSYYYKVYAVDKAFNYSTEITATQPTATAPLVSTDAAPTALASVAATLGGNVTSDGGNAINARGILYALTSANAAPVLGGSGVINETASGTTGAFTVTVSGLGVNSQYSYRAYATNTIETTYGSIFTFTTLDGKPIVTTDLIPSGLTSIGATLGGNVTTDSGNAVNARGIVYSLTSANANPVIGGGSVTNEPASGTTGTFTVNASGLNANKQYSYKSYATNIVGTAYGSAVAFYTLATVPNALTVDTPTPSNLSVTLAADGNPSETEYAIQEEGGNYLQTDGSLAATAVWHTAGDWGTKVVTGLTSNTLYTFKVKARNGANVQTAFSATSSGTTSVLSSATLAYDSLAAFGSLCLNSSITNSFTLTGHDLTTDEVIVGPLAGFSFSTSLNGTYSPSLEFNADLSGALSQLVYVKFTPTLVQSYTTPINLSGGGASSVNVPVSGTGINTPATVSTGAGSGVTSTGATLTGSYTQGCSAVIASGIQYSTDSSYSNITAFNTPITGLTPNTVYNYRAYATDATGTVTGTSSTFTTLNLSAPVAVTADPILHNNFTAKWNSVAGAAGYRLDVSKISTFATPAAVNEGFEGAFPPAGWLATSGWAQGTDSHSGAAAAIANPSGGGTLTMSAVAYPSQLTFWLGRNSNNTNKVLTIEVSTTSQTSGFIAIATYDHSTVPSNTFTQFTVNLSSYASSPTVYIRFIRVANGTSSPYRLDDIVVSSAASAFLPGYNNLDVGNATSHTVTGLSPNTTYYYRVRAVSSNSTSTNSNAITVTTAFPAPSQPSVITGSNIVCAGSSQTYSVTDDAAATSYSWTLPSGWIGTSTANSITVTAGSSGGTISVAAVNSTGPSTARDLAVTVNPLQTPTVGLTSSDLDNVFAYGTGVTFTAAASGVSGNTGIVYDFKVNGVSRQSGSSNSFTTTTISDQQQVSVSISVTGGTCMQATTASSNIITNTVSGAVLVYISNFCGQTLPFLTAPIYSTTAVVTGNPTVQYQFRVKRVGGASETLALRSTPGFNLTQSTLYAYNTSYEVYVSAVVNGVVQPESSACTITTPAAVPPATVQSTYCGSTLADAYSPIFAATVPGATGYRFDVFQGSTHITTVERSVNYFYLTNLPSWTYNTSYTVYVAVKINNEAFGGFGTVPCTVTTPQLATPGLVACGSQMATVSSPIFTTTVSGLTNYAFEVSGPGINTTINRSLPYFYITGITGWNYGTTYTVKVTVTKGSEVGPQSTGCLLTTPSIPGTSVKAAQCDQILTNAASPIYAEAVYGATGYRFHVSDGTNETTVERTVNYFSINTVSFWQYNKVYSITVEAVRNNSVSPVLTTCSVTTPEGPFTTIPEAVCNNPELTRSGSLSVNAYPGASSYLFVIEEYNDESVLVNTYTKVSYTNSVALNTIAGLPTPTQAGITYAWGVQVAVMGKYGEVTKGCSFTLIPTPSVRMAQVTFSATAYPNPFASDFMVNVKTNSQSVVNVKVYDMVGRLVEQRDVKASDMESTNIGNSYPSGVYNVVVSQDDNLETVRVIKR